MPLIKNTTYMCPRCTFYELCQIDEKGDTRSAEEFKQAMYATRDPYENHRKSAAE
jgi:hypothetical protein